MPDRLQAQYVCPASHRPLMWQGDALVASDGSRYAVTDGIPDLTWPHALHATDQKAREFYDGRVEAYDKYLHLTFETFGEDEKTVRRKMIDTLELTGRERVLEVSCGSGRDSELLLARMKHGGELYLQDLSHAMVERCRDRLRDTAVPVHLCVSNACHLPYPDRQFDAIYHFGGLGEFSDIPGALREMVRVTKPGGRVLVGDESMPPWLRDTRFAKVLTFTNPQFSAELPLKHLPVEAREVRLRWIIGGTFYLIDFVVGEGEPPANFEFEIPGPRGGTHLTRYLGQLEGVTTETKKLAYEACAKTGLSMHAWLDQVVRQAAERDLK